MAPNIELFFGMLKDLGEDFVDTCRDCKNIIHDGVDDISQDIQEIVTGKASSIGLEEPVRKHYEKKNKRKKTRKKLKQSLRNFLLSAPGQSISSTKQLRKGDHICMYSFGSIISHHGIYIGKGKIIHYAPDFNGNVSVRTDNIDYAVNNGEVRQLRDSESPRKYPRKEVLSRAFSRLGEKKYDLFMENCEHFARWARSGE